MRVRPIIIVGKESYKEYLKSCGIIDASRTLYCLVERSWMKTQFPRTFKCILVSTCVQQSKNSLSHMGRPYTDSLNTTETIVNVYQLTCSSYDLHNLKDANFVIDNAHSNHFFTNHSAQRIEASDLSFYHSKFNVEDFDYDAGQGPVIPPIDFYSIEHMREKTGDWFDMRLGEGRTHFRGMEFLDEITEVSFIDSKMWFDDEDLLESSHSQSTTVTDDILQIVERAFPVAFRGLYHGTTFLYETGKGKNILGGTVIHHEHTFAKKAIEDAKHILAHLDLIGQDIEAMYGNVRIHYTPLLHGDRIKVIFRDWKDLKHKPGVDRGLTNDRTITNAIMTNEDADYFS